MIAVAAFIGVPLALVYADYCYVPSSYQRVTGHDDIYTEAGLEMAIVAETNRVRYEHGLGQLAHEPAIRAIAQEHSVNMAFRDRFSHEIDGLDATDRAMLGGYTCRKYHPDGSYSYGLSENIGVISDDVSMGLDAKAREFVQMWLDSPGHRENLLDPEATKIGVGVAISETSVLSDSFGRAIFATQNFGSC